jgi:hypothetical protein
MNELQPYPKYLSCRKRGRSWEEQVIGLSAPLYVNLGTLAEEEEKTVLIFIKS